MIRSVCDAAVLAVAALGVVWAAGMSPLAAAESGDACTTSRKYIELIQTKKFDEIGNLYAPDAVFYTPVGTVLRGK